MEKPKKFHFPTASILMLTLALAMSGNARAQVTIGANIEPQSFSVLELISNNTKGLRLPQMNYVQRNAMMETQAFKNEKKGKALGLRIFNTSTNCVNTWNGTKWIEECAPVTFPDTTDIDGTINIATFVNVMYDFQYQEMYVYQETGDPPVSYQWFAKRVGQGSLDFTWDKPENNPCPLGWRIPSMWNWWDIFEGDGLENDTVEYMYPTIGGNTVNNNWQIRDVSSNGTAYGGAIATNSANEKIFLPIIGVRRMDYGDLHYGKTEHIGNYWSSTYGKIFSAYDVAFFNGETNSVEIGQYARSLGYCVRCVAEPPK